MRSVFDRNFDKFEIYLLRNIFQIPADFVFLHDQPPIPFYDTTTTQSNEASTTPSTESSDIGAPTEQQIDDELINLQRELELVRSDPFWNTSFNMTIHNERYRKEKE